jgi:hypothetical protein
LGGSVKRTLPPKRTSKDDYDADGSDAVFAARTASKVETEKFDFKEQKSNPKEACNGLASRSAAAFHRPCQYLELTRATMNRFHPSYRLRAEVVTQLGSAVAYHSRATGDIDKKIIDQVNDYGEINNRTIQRLFDVDVYAARDILRDLVGREVISRSSSKKREPR